MRVYSRALERQVHHVPRRLLESGNDDQGYQTNSALKAVSLHELIRQQDRPYSTRLNWFDNLFTTSPPESVDDGQIDEYEKLIKKASVEELRTCDVILCTCICSAGRRVVEGLNVEQVVIDECGMCTEPTCLVPLVSYPSARQVTLIGDHKQLQPIVVNPVAKRIGLGKSLFERYAIGASTLKTQYRMVKLYCINYISREF